MKRQYGLIGYPLSHSFSQKYFTEKFIREGIRDADFYVFPIPSIYDLPAILQQHPKVQGLAVTIPYKRDVIAFLDEVSADVQQMNACNCIKIKDGKLSGFNTDIAGFEKSFVKKLQPHHHKALVLGTGGASSAVKYVLQKLQIDYCSVSRSKDPAKNIIGYDDLGASLLASHQIIINATPLGTYPNVDEAPPVPYQLITPDHYLFDLVYNPPKTKFLVLGEQQGAAIENGYEMLVLQAEENWKIWNTV